MTRTVHSGRWTRADRAAHPFRYLPVELPPGTATLTVTLDYDRSAGVLDLGCAGPSGFRGWSGGARSAYGIGPDRATPGYLPGPLEPGTWHVILGLHRVGPDGVGWQVTAETGPALATPPGWTSPPQVAAAPSTRDSPHRTLPAADGLRWLAGDLHSHTVHSDGALTPDELGLLAAGRGLDFLAVTDHNTVSHHATLAGASARTGIALLPGQEVTTSTGHANALGAIGWVDFRRPADDWLAGVEADGGLLSVNHPLAADCAWRQPLSRRPRHAEVWHSSWLDRRWGGPMAWWQAWDVDVVPVGGSDFHRAGADAPPGAPTTWVACEAARVDAGDVLGAVLAGLRAGRVAVAAEPAAPVLLRIGDGRVGDGVRGGHDDDGHDDDGHDDGGHDAGGGRAGELVALGADGLLLADPTGRRTAVRGDRAVLGDARGPHWLEDHDTTVVALTA